MVVIAEPLMEEEAGMELLPTVSLPSQSTSAPPQAAVVIPGSASMDMVSLEFQLAWPVAHDDDDDADGCSPWLADDTEHYDHDFDQSVDHALENEVSPDDEPTRAQFISATAFKPTRETGLGLDITLSSAEAQGTNDSKRTRIQISGISPDGLFSASPFQVGDILISVNHKTCVGMTVAGISQWIQKLKGTLTLVVCHETGHPKLVESWIAKPPLREQKQKQLNKSSSSSPSPSRMLWGMRLREHYTPDGRPPTVVIAGIQLKGFAVDSLCNAGDTLVSINGRRVRTVKEAAHILVTANCVHLVAKTQNCAGVVIGTASPRRLHRLSPQLVEESFGRDAPAIRARCDSVRVTRTVSNFIGFVLAISVWLQVNKGVLAFAIPGLVMVLLLNLPWLFRAPGKRCSLVQVLCNVTVIVPLLYCMIAKRDTITLWINLQGFLAFVVPLLVLINLPSFVLDRGFARQDDDNDGADNHRRPDDDHGDAAVLDV